MKVIITPYNFKILLKYIYLRKKFLIINLLLKNFKKTFFKIN
jgi:hypothetical protein